MNIKKENYLTIEPESGVHGNYIKLPPFHLDSRSAQYNEEGSLMINHLIKQIFSQDSKGNFMVSYYSPTRQMFVYLATSPLETSTAIPKLEIESGVIKLRLRSILTNDLSLSIPEDDASDSADKVGRRTKERKIGYIIEKVARWRNLYNGIQDSKGNTIKMTLEEAAKKVDISKKSLDDYLLQLRFGRKYGFNFEEHKNDKVGLLRAYVKKFKKLQTKSGIDQNELTRLLNEKGTPLCKSNNCCIPPPGAIRDTNL